MNPNGTLEPTAAARALLDIRDKYAAPFTGDDDPKDPAAGLKQKQWTSSRSSPAVKLALTVLVWIGP
jgi:hypothetical protein